MAFEKSEIEAPVGAVYVDDIYLLPAAIDETGKMSYRADQLREWLGMFGADAMVQIDPCRVLKPSSELPSKLIDDRLCIDWGMGTIQVEDRPPVQLFRKQAQLLESLVREINRIVTYEDLVEDIWNYEMDTSTLRALNVHASRLRQRLGVLGPHLVTRRSFGYGLFEVIPSSFPQKTSVTLT